MDDETRRRLDAAFERIAALEERLEKIEAQVRALQPNWMRKDK
jgi:K+/H+ antiporter YhaU regulatory subunit KhtT